VENHDQIARWIDVVLDATAPEQHRKQAYADLLGEFYETIESAADKIAGEHLDANAIEGEVDLLVEFEKNKFSQRSFLLRLRQAQNFKAFVTTSAANYARDWFDDAGLSPTRVVPDQSREQ